MASHEFRNLSNILLKLRNFLLGREHLKTHRYAFELSARSQPQPCLPGGVHSNKFADNYYYERDARRFVERPKILAERVDVPMKRGFGKRVVCWERPPAPTPGKIHWWDGPPGFYSRPKSGGSCN